MRDVGGLGTGERAHGANPAGDLLPTAQTKSRNKTKLVKEVGVTNRRIRADILSDTSGGADLTVKFVLVDTVGSGGFRDVAGTAGKHKLVGMTVFLWVEQVGTSKSVSDHSQDRLCGLKDSPFTAEAEVDLVGLLGVATGGR